MKPARIMSFFMAVPVLLILSACVDGNDLNRDKYTDTVSDGSRIESDLKWDATRRPADILRFAGVRDGMTVVDVLGGSGYWTELSSRLVGPGGTVYLHNNDAFLSRASDRVDQRLSGGRLGNVHRLDTELASMDLPADVDLVILSLVYHDVLIVHDDVSVNVGREAFSRQIWDSLRDGGRVLIIDHAAKSGSAVETADKIHRIAEEFVINEFVDAGFQLEGTLNVLRNPDDDQTAHIFDDALRHKTDRFVLLFRKSVEPAASKVQ